MLHVISINLVKVKKSLTSTVPIATLFLGRIEYVVISWKPALPHIDIGHTHLGSTRNLILSFSFTSTSNLNSSLTSSLSFYIDQSSKMLHESC
jgi:hypothetical protein